MAEEEEKGREGGGCIEGENRVRRGDEERKMPSLMGGGKSRNNNVNKNSLESIYLLEEYYQRP